MNRLYQQLGSQPTPQVAGNTKSLPSLKNNLNQIQSLLNSSDPNSLIQNLISQNPKAKEVMSLFQSSGMTPKQFFYEYAQKQGIDPNQFLNG